MTDQTPDVAETIGGMWQRVKATLAEAVQDEFGLVPDPDAVKDKRRQMGVMDRLRVANALGACLDGDDQAAAELLAGLDDAQLYAIEGAGSALAIHASRLRVPDKNEQPLDGEPDDRAAVRHMLADIIKHLEGRDATTISTAVWARVRPALQELAARVDEQRQRAEYALHLHALAEAEATRQRRRAEATERERGDEAAHARRFAGYLNAARDAAGAKDWPSIPNEITALRLRADDAEARDRDLRERLAAADREYGRLRERADATEEARARWQERGEEAEARIRCAGLA